MDRKIYKLPFRRTEPLKWICPTCKKNQLKILNGSFIVKETPESKKNRPHPGWEPDWISYIYSCMLICSNNGCKEIVSSTGEGFVDFDPCYDENGQLDQIYNDFYRPKYFFPHLQLFQYPPNTPESVVEEIEASFELFFCNASSASNHVRIALENLLTALKIKRFTTTNKCRFYLSLHQRIGLLPKKYAHLENLFLAIKWLGNAGSHSTQSITMDDVLDAFEILEEILTDLYLKNKLGIQKMAKEINKKKGPRKR